MYKTLIIGASTKPERYAYKAALRLTQEGHQIVLVGNKPGSLLNQPILTSFDGIKDIHTVTLYINPTIQKDYYSKIIELQPKRVIFNPGTENSEFKLLLEKAGIIGQEACTLVLLSTKQY